MSEKAEPDVSNRSLSAAVRRRDGSSIVAMLAGAPPEDLLQHAGSALLVALAVGADGAPELVPKFVTALDERRASGDDVLAQQLTAAAGGPPSGRKPLTVDLEQLVSVLEENSDGDGGYLDLSTGESTPAFAFEDGDGDGDSDQETDREDAERWLYIPSSGSRDSWRDMRDFAATRSDPVLRERLLEAVNGGGAFSRFKRTLDRYPDEVYVWLSYRAEYQLGRARSWLAGEGYDGFVS